MTIHMFSCTVYNQSIIHNFIMGYLQLYDKTDQLWFNSLECSDFFEFSWTEIKKKDFYI